MPSSINDFIPIRELGNGAQGRVLLIQEKSSSKKLFACKEILCPSQSVLDTAVAEIKSLMRLEHPNIIRYEDFFIVAAPDTATNNNNNNQNGGGGTTTTTTVTAAFDQAFQSSSAQRQRNNGIPPSNSNTLSTTTKVYLLTEYCDNGDLSVVIRKATDSFFEHGKHPIAESRILEWLSQCCRALDLIHKRFIHRDIKPTNVFLCSADDSVKLGDFGLATPIHNDNMSICGTLSYLAPEQLLRQKPNSAVDVFGLGATFLELVTLQDKSINTQLLERGPQVLESVFADVINMNFSKDFATLLTDMMQKKPEDRPSPAGIITRIQKISSSPAAATSSSSSLGIKLSFGNSKNVGSSNRTATISPEMNNNNNNTNEHSRNVTPTSALLLSQQQLRFGTVNQHNNNMNNNMSSSSSPKCSLCKTFVPIVVCDICDEVLCADCDNLKHRNSRNLHRRTPIHNNNNNNPSTVSANGASQSLQQQQQQQRPSSTTTMNNNNNNNPDSCPNSLGSSFEGGNLPGISANNNNNNNNQNQNSQLPPLGANGQMRMSASLSAISPLDPNFVRGNNNTNSNNTNNGNAPFSRNVAVISKNTTGNNNNILNSGTSRPNSPFNNINGNSYAPPEVSNNNNNHNNNNMLLRQPSPSLACSSSSQQQQQQLQQQGPTITNTIEVPTTTYPNIAQAIRMAPSGTRIIVNGHGVYTEPLEFVRSDIELVGRTSNSNSNSNQLPSSSASSSLLRPSIDVRGSVSHTVIKIGPDVSRIKISNLNLKLSGPGVGDKQSVILLNDCQGIIVSQCDIVSDTGTGLAISGHRCSDPLITGCSIVAKLSGIHLSNGAGAVICHNAINNTGLAGVLIKKKATPRIYNNTFDNNLQAGIFFFKASGIAERNAINNCGGCAFVVKGSGSMPTIRKNKIQHCGQAGVLCSDESRGTIAENVIYKMRKTGILIKTNANPTVVRNQISHGHEAGVYVFENGAGHIEENDISENSNAGIIITTGGNPFVISNRILRNQFEGIWVCNEGKGTFEKNFLEGNGRKGPVDIQDGCEVEWHQ